MKIHHFLFFSIITLVFNFCLFGEGGDEYRNFDDSTQSSVKDFYKMNHISQTWDFVLQKEQEYLSLTKQHLSVFEAMELVNQIIDESDPDLDLPQCYHFYQTAEALRKDGHPRWLILTGFIHDLGKILTLYGEPQWAVVGDTFPVGCAYSDQIVFSEYFAYNPDSHNEIFNNHYGVYKEKCGFDNLHMSWGHDEYLYQVTKNYLPEEAGYIIRFHSFYAAHNKNAYEYFMTEKDKRMMPWLKLFSTYDLYSKTSEKLDIEKLKPYYEELVAEFFPDKIEW
jgi:inositol oxygenase